MTITRVIGKGRTAPLERDAFTELLARYENATVDVGTGDGRFAYHLASADPTRLVIGIDALDEPMGEVAARPRANPPAGDGPTWCSYARRSRTCRRS